MNFLPLQMINKQQKQIYILIIMFKLGFLKKYNLITCRLCLHQTVIQYDTYCHSFCSSLCELIRQLTSEHYSSLLVTTIKIRCNRKSQRGKNMY